MKKWTYKVDKCADEAALTEALTEHGAEGWELVSVVAYEKFGDFTRFLAVFKREAV